MRPTAATVAGVSVMLGIGALDVAVRNTYTGETKWLKVVIERGKTNEETVRFEKK